MDLRGKVVLVTGSSSGIGREAAIQFARKGSIVVVTYCRHRKAGERIRRECLLHGPAELMHLDVRDNRSVSTAVRQVTRRFGRLDILVNNAGVLSVAPLHRQSPRGIIVKAAEEKLGKRSGDDVDIWEYLDESP